MPIYYRRMSASQHGASHGPNEVTRVLRAARHSPADNVVLGSSHGPVIPSYPIGHVGDPLDRRLGLSEGTGNPCCHTARLDGGAGPAGRSVAGRGGAGRGGVWWAVAGWGGKLGRGTPHDPERAVGRIQTMRLWRD